MTNSNKPSVLVARAVFPSVLERLSAYFEVDSNQADVVLSPAELKARLQGKVAAFTTGSERIDATLLQACPSLQLVANMAVGYNNLQGQRCELHQYP
jgi:glyoxylate/hydroxypyruvate/2-ketogluconate reductase